MKVPPGNPPPPWPTARLVPAAVTRPPPAPPHPYPPVCTRTPPRRPLPVLLSPPLSPHPYPPAGWPCPVPLLCRLWLPLAADRARSPHRPTSYHRAVCPPFLPQNKRHTRHQYFLLCSPPPRPLPTSMHTYVSPNSSWLSPWNVSLSAMPSAWGVAGAQRCHLLYNCAPSMTTRVNGYPRAPAQPVDLPLCVHPTTHAQAQPPTPTLRLTTRRLPAIHNATRKQTFQNLHADQYILRYIARPPCSS